MAANALNALQNHAQNVYLLLLLAAVLCTLAGAWFAARPNNNSIIWMILVATASCGISALVALMLLPMVVGFHALTLLDAALALVVAIGAVRTWSGSLDQVEFL